MMLAMAALPSNPHPSAFGGTFLAGAPPTYQIVVRISQRGSRLAGSLQRYRGKDMDGRPIQIVGTVSGRFANLRLGRLACTADVLRERRTQYLKMFCPTGAMQHMAFLRVGP